MNTNGKFWRLFAPPLMVIVTGGAIFASQAAFAQEIPVRGVVRPIQEATIATDLFAPVTQLPLKEGQSFVVGDVLVEFNCASYLARRKGALAEHRAHQLELENKQALVRHNAVGRHEVGLAETQVDASAAKIEELDTHINQCTIKAPFAGRVAELFVNEYEMPAAGNPVVRIINDNVFEVELIVPSDWLYRLQKGSRLSFKVDETKTTYEIRIIRFGAAVDPVSQTVSIVGKFAAHPAGVVVGMSGSARLAEPEG